MVTVRLGHMFWAFFVLVLNIVYAYIGASFVFEPLRNEFILGSRNNSCEVVGVLFKFLVILISNINMSQAVRWIRLAIGSGVLLIRTRFYLEFPYYNLKISLGFFTFNSLGILFIIGSWLGTIGNFQQEVISFIWLCLIPVALKMSDIVYKLLLV
jgi:hypothetical protein